VVSKANELPVTKLFVRLMENQVYGQTHHRARHTEAWIRGRALVYIDSITRLTTQTLINSNWKNHILLHQLLYRIGLYSNTLFYKTSHCIRQSNNTPIEAKFYKLLLLQTFKSKKLIQYILENFIHKQHRPRGRFVKYQVPNACKMNLKMTLV